MHTEIEAKLKLDSLQEVENRLAELKAEFLEERSQIDYYFDDVNRTLTKTDRCLRLRRQLTKEQEKVFLTYKGPKEKDQLKKRREIEIEVGNVDSTRKLLSALGYDQALVVEKKRRIYRLGGCVVALDELPLLGSFVEIEGSDDGKIVSVQKDLGLADLQHIPISYASLMAEKLSHESSE
ncbi:MAG: class IV adenylate cyclase [Planctomycetota bacterium]|jgi:adenylate cyclase class 2